MRASEKLPATVVAVAGSAGLDLTLRDPPRRWIGEVPRDVYTHRTLLPLRSPAEMGWAAMGVGFLRAGETGMQGSPECAHW